MTGAEEAGTRSADGAFFDRCDWLYAFLRERCFRDDTARIEEALWADAARPRRLLLELGCGPAIYARHLAAAHPELTAIGVDRSPRQLARARLAAAAARLGNCTFQRSDAEHLPQASGSVDAIVASRLLMVLDDPAAAVAEMYRVLAPGGRCFVAEPRSSVRAHLPLALLRVVAGGSVPRQRILADDALLRLLRGVPWRIRSFDADRGYRYVLCEKPA